MPVDAQSDRLSWLLEYMEQVRVILLISICLTIVHKTMEDWHIHDNGPIYPRDIILTLQ